MSHPSQIVDRRSKKLSALAARQVERREWWLWGFAFIVTVFLTVAIIFLVLPGEHSERNPLYWANLREWVRGLAALVLLFDVYTMYQHLQLQRVRRQLAERDELFQLITENAADMIAVVTHDGKRVYSSPAYEKVLGYSAEELAMPRRLTRFIRPIETGSKQPQRKLIALGGAKSWNIECATKTDHGAFWNRRQTRSELTGGDGEARHCQSRHH